MPGDELTISTVKLAISEALEKFREADDERLDRIFAARDKVHDARAQVLAAQIAQQMAEKVEGIFKNGGGLGSVKKDIATLSNQVLHAMKSAEEAREVVVKMRDDGCAIGQTCRARASILPAESTPPAERKWAVFAGLKRLNPAEMILVVALAIVAIAGIGSAGVEVIERVFSALGALLEKVFS